MHIQPKTACAATALACALALTACGSGDSSTDHQDSASTARATDAEIIADLKSSNIDFLASNRPAVTWRWLGTPAQRIRVYLPAPASGNATEQDYAAKVTTAIATLNARLSGLLVLESSATPPASGNYIQISYGTSYVPPGSTNYAGYCANVSTGPNLGNMILPDAQNGIASMPVFINLGNGRCDVTQDIVTHEFGHALGLSSHFSGFGNDGPAQAMVDVLATLYGNPAGTAASALVIRRAAQ
jgi:hypothetical protein